MKIILRLGWAMVCIVAIAFPEPQESEGSISSESPEASNTSQPLEESTPQTAQSPIQRLRQL